MSTADEIRLMATQAEQRIERMRVAIYHEVFRNVRARCLWTIHLCEVKRNAQHQITYIPR